MNDLLYKTDFDSLIFGDDTTIGYLNLSTEVIFEKTAEDDAGNEKAAGYKWVTGSDLKGKLEQLSLIWGSEPLTHDVSKGRTVKPQIMFLAVYGLLKNRALALKKDHFENIIDILDGLRFRREFLQAIGEKTGHVACFTAFEDEESPGWISVVVKTPHSAANFFLMLRIRISDRSTVCCLIIEDDQMLKSMVDRLYARKTTLQEAPLQILSIICEEYGYRNELWREELDISIVSLEQRIVKSGSDIESFGEGIAKDEPLIRKLHETNTNLTWLDCTTNFELKLLQFSKETIELYERLREEHPFPTVSRRSRMIIEQGIKSMMSSCMNRQYHGRGLQERAKVQISTLSSQISQRDSRINLSTARDSKEIARSTLRDGKVMKTIAVLGLLFLPAALLASIYGSGIVDLHSGEVALPPFWWTYVVATVILTALVLMLWALYIRQANLVNINETSNKLQELEKGEKLD